MEKAQIEVRSLLMKPPCVAVMCIQWMRLLPCANRNLGHNAVRSIQPDAFSKMRNLKSL